MSNSDFLHALGWAVINSFWQLALLWVIYQVWTAVFRKSKASIRSAMATGLLITGFLWFLFTFISLLSEGAAAITEAFPYLYGPAGWNHWIQEILPIASGIYLVLLLFPIINFIRNYRYVQLIRQHALQKADVKWRLFVQRLSGQMGIRKKVTLWVSDLVQSPVTIGFLRPVILLPVAAVNHLNTEQVEAILLHELAHIRRFDYFLNLLVRLIQTVLYFNPFIRAFVRIIETEREKSCDEMVMQFQYDAHGYAAALLTLEKATGGRSQKLAVAAAGAHKQQLLGRVENILGVKSQKKLTGIRLAGIFVALLCITGTHALLQWKKPAMLGEAEGLYANSASPFLFFSESREANASEFQSPALATYAFTESVPSYPASSGTVATADDEAAVEEEEFTIAENDNTQPSLYSSLFTQITGRENILSKEQEAEVEKALASSQKLLNEVQWKIVEESIADALTLAEKEIVRFQLQKEAEKADWEHMSQILRQAYGEINWPVLNAELEKAVAVIRLDSLQRVYSLAATSLAELEKELATVDAKSIPDTDITAEAITAKRKLIENYIREIQKAKARKIIKL